MPKKLPINHYLKALAELLSAQNIKQLEDKLGTGEGTLRKYIEGKNKELNPNTIQLILNKFPQLNERWIKTGEEPMFRDLQDVRPSDFIETDPVKTLIAKAKRHDMNMKDMQDALAILLTEHNKAK